VSLLSSLLDHIPPTLAGADKTPRPIVISDRPGPALLERAHLMASSPHVSAATATPQWRTARDLYLNHLMACRSCYAPAGRHCKDGADLRATYDHTPMEARP